MITGTRERLYTESLGTKVTEETMAAVEDAAKALNMRPAEWLRLVVQRALANGESIPGQEWKHVMAEVLAFRQIFMALQEDQYHDFSVPKAMAEKIDARRYDLVEVRLIDGVRE